MFFQEPPPDTSSYMTAGYIIAFTVMTIYLLSYIIRWRNLTKDLEVLERLRKPTRARSAGELARRGRRSTSRR